MSSPLPSFTLPVRREEDRFACAAEGVRIARWAGLPERAQQELAIAIAELVSNAVRHAGGGEIEVRAIHAPAGDPPSQSGTSSGKRTDRPRLGVEVIVRDSGPGLDPRFATEEGANSLPPRLPGQGGLGIGLGAVHRLMSSVVIRSAPGVSTEIVAIKWG
ncbi:ATP-binding protein [Chondromyces apiculatus]|uniref:ATP-binding region, ATPase-like protein n=1 Tax=Chondromyces apiculatus DSM 436 TaxID=1192034 RepID=A0A017SZA6_9BACT|nr:ATP-binding protein [Chondromyces apiculatus]EYF01621.1 ATP-binding region, ATPase-like protein [Chondromyces apiculatus DSM 436]